MENIDTCSLCFETYEEALRPRMLQCGHTYCTDCIGKLIIKGSPVCPMCNTSISASDASQIPINYALEKCISTMKDYVFTLKSQLEVPAKIRTMQDVIDSQKKNAHGLLLSYEAFDIDVSEYQKFLETNVLKNKDLATKLRERATWLAKKLHGRADWHESIVKVMLEEQEKVKEAKTKAALFNKKLKASLHELDCTTENEDAVAIALSKILVDFGNLSSCLCRNQAELPDPKIFSSEKVALGSVDMIREYERVSEDDETPISTSAECSPILEVDQLTIMDKLIPWKENEMVVTMDDLRSKPNIWNRRITSNKVLAVSTIDGCKRSAALSLKNGKVYLHCLQHQEILPSSFQIKHKEFLGSVRKDSLTVFLDWGIDGSFKGQIHIKMHSESPLAKHFTAICTGELGPTYINKKVSVSRTSISFNSYNKSELISGSDPLNLINLRDVIYNSTSEKGTIWMNGDGSFVINITSVGSNFVSVFGKAVDGMDLLIDLGIKSSGNITIIDSGILF